MHFRISKWHTNNLKRVFWQTRVHIYGEMKKRTNCKADASYSANERIEKIQTSTSRNRIIAKLANKWIEGWHESKTLQRGYFFCKHANHIFDAFNEGVKANYIERVDKNDHGGDVDYREARVKSFKTLHANRNENPWTR